MEIIDFNVHLTENDLWFGKKVDNIDRFIETLIKCNIKKAVIQPLKVNCNTEYVAKLCNNYPNYFYGFGTISTNDYKNEIDLIIKNKLSGCKFHPRFQNDNILSLDENGIFRELEINNIPIAICCWPQVKNKKLKISDVSPLIIDSMAKKYPKLIFIILHLGGHNLWDAIFCSRSNSNVYLDCSYFFNFFKNTSIEKDFWEIIDKIDEKILYGSDYPEVDIIENLKYVKNRAFKKMRNPEKLFSTNFLKIIEG